MDRRRAIDEHRDAPSGVSITGTAAEPSLRRANAPAARGDRRRPRRTIRCPLGSRRGPRCAAGRAKRQPRSGRRCPHGVAIRPGRRAVRSVRADLVGDPAARARRPHERNLRPGCPRACPIPGRRDLLDPSAADVPRCRFEPYRGTVRDRRVLRGRRGRCPRARPASGDEPVRGTGGSSRRLSRSCLDLLEPARRARGDGRRAVGARRHRERPRAAHAARASHRGQLGRARRGRGKGSRRSGIGRTARATGTARPSWSTCPGPSRWGPVACPDG